MGDADRCRCAARCHTRDRQRCPPEQRRRGVAQPNDSRCRPWSPQARVVDRRLRGRGPGRRSDRPHPSGDGRVARRQRRRDRADDERHRGVGQGVLGARQHRWNPRRRPRPRRPHRLQLALHGAAAGLGDAPVLDRDHPQRSRRHVVGRCLEDDARRSRRTRHGDAHRHAPRARQPRRRRRCVVPRRGDPVLPRRLPIDRPAPRERARDRLRCRYRYRSQVAARPAGHGDALRPHRVPRAPRSTGHRRRQRELDRHRHLRAVR